MKLIILSDIHGAADQVEELCRQEPQADLILICGDITHFGEADQAVGVLNALKAYPAPFAAVHGNCDYESVIKYLSADGVSIHLNQSVLAGVSLLGIGGSLPAPIFTPSTYTEEEGSGLLDGFAGNIPENPWIFVTHQPPAESDADRIQNGMHVGSTSVADFIRTQKPALVCTGHIHESFSVSRFGDSLLVNPGSLKEGRYAIAEIDGDNVAAELKML